MIIAGFRARLGKEHDAYAKIMRVQLQMSTWSAYPWSKAKNNLHDHSKIEQRKTFRKAFVDRICHFRIVTLDLIDALFWCRFVLQRQSISEINCFWYSNYSVLKFVFFPFKSSTRFMLIQRRSEMSSALEYCIDWTQDSYFRMEFSIWKLVTNFFPFKSKNKSKNLN